MAPVARLLLVVVVVVVVEVAADVSVRINGDVVVTVAVASPSAFRLGVRCAGDAHGALPSPSLAPGIPAPASAASWGDFTGVQTAFGALGVAADGRWELRDAGKRTVLAGAAPVVNTSVANGLVSTVVTPALHADEVACHE